MTSLIDEVTAAIVRFDPGDAIFLRAKGEYALYDFKIKARNILIRHREDPKRVYTTRITYRDTEMLARCTCPSYIQRGERPCKHCYMVALNLLGKTILEREWDNLNEAVKAIILDDYDVLKACPGIDTVQLRGAFFHIKDQIPKKSEPEPEVEDDWETTPQEKSHQKFKDEVAELPSVQKAKALVKTTEDFGGKVGKIPKGYVVKIYGKPYTTVKGVLWLANGSGLVECFTDPVKWSHETKDGRAIFKATTTFSDGKKFSAFGVAIPIVSNVKNKKIWPFIDHLAETRAIGRALRNALALIEPTAEEMADYEAKKQ